MKTTSKPIKVYSIRIEYEGGMERLEVSAKNSVDVFERVAKLIKIKQRCSGVHRKLTGIIIEKSAGKPLIEIL